MIDMEVGRRVDACARFVQGEARKIVSRAQPVRIYGKKAGRSRKGLDPSKPGEPPKKVTGDLRKTIRKEFDSASMTARVGTNLPYGRYLEMGTGGGRLTKASGGARMAPRPWLRPTLVNHQGEIKRRFGIGVKI